ncbi:MAG: hypothetical protein ACOZAM_21905 [Pseudomonadota bacterium]
MRDSHLHSERTVRHLRRETRMQAARIAFPAIGIAAYYLVTSAMPIFNAVLGSMAIEVSQEIEDGLTTGILLTIVAIAVYYLALRALWRLKVVEAAHSDSHLNV